MSPPHRSPVAPVSFWVRGLRLVLLRPTLWPTAVRQGVRLTRPQWWQRAPFLPLPDPEYLRFRFETQYGAGAGARPDPRDLVAYLEWCRGMEQGRRSSREPR